MEAHTSPSPTVDESEGYRTVCQQVNGSGRIRITVTELRSGREASEELRMNAISGGTHSIRQSLIRQLERDS